MKVLVVDDSAMMRKLIAKSIENKYREADIDEATDGAMAVRMASLEKYNVILMDWNMPNMLGIDALKKLRAAGNQTPIIMITTEGEKAHVLEAIKSGASNYITKPFQPDALVGKIESIINK